MASIVPYRTFGAGVAVFTETLKLETEIRLARPPGAPPRSRDE